MVDPFGRFHRLHKHVFDSFRPWNHLNVNNLCNLNKHKKYFDHLRPLSAYVICESSCTDRTSCISSKKYQDIFVFWYNSWAQVRAVTNLDVTCGSVLLENRSWNIHFWVSYQLQPQKVSNEQVKCCLYAWQSAHSSKDFSYVTFKKENICKWIYPPRFLLPNSKVIINLI